MTENPDDAARRNEKKRLRRWALERRGGLDMPDLSRRLVAQLAALPDVIAARQLMLYLALPSEVDVEPLINLLREDGIERTFYVPRCAPERRLALHPYEPEVTPLVTSDWGLREPDPAQVPEADPSLLDVVIVPTLLATSDGGRLGYGGGYYDRFLLRLRPDARRIAAVPSALVVPTLPLDWWDAGLDQVVTEAHLVSIEGGVNLLQ